MEDSRFYQHEGVDFIGLTRAIVVNLILERKSQVQHHHAATCQKSYFEQS